MIESTTENAPNNESSQMSEFEMPRWSVITSDGCAASHQSYAEAARLVAAMSQNSHGLCIVTDEAAQKMCAAKNDEPPKTELQTEDLSQKSFQDIL